VRSYEDEGREGGREGGVSVLVGGKQEGVVGGEEEEGWRGGMEGWREGGEKQWQLERQHDEELSPGHSAAML
jgi:hypothetical protein